MQISDLDLEMNFPGPGHEESQQSSLQKGPPAQLEVATSYSQRPSYHETPSCGGTPSFVEEPHPAEALTFDKAGEEQHEDDLQKLLLTIADLRQHAEGLCVPCTDYVSEDCPEPLSCANCHLPHRSADEPRRSRPSKTVRRQHKIEIFRLLTDPYLDDKFKVRQLLAMARTSAYACSILQPLRRKYEQNYTRAPLPEQQTPA